MPGLANSGTIDGLYPHRFQENRIMNLHRRAAAAVVVVAAATLAAPLALAQGKKDSATIGMVLEPPGLDPTIAPSAAIGQIVHYNILEGLTKINADGSSTPLLAESWTMD